MGLFPAGSELVVSLATPFEIVPLPSVTEPMVKLTVPVVDAGSVSTNVTAEPTVDGFCVEARLETGVVFAVPPVRLAIEPPLPQPALPTRAASHLKRSTKTNCALPSGEWLHSSEITRQSTAYK